VEVAADCYGHDSGRTVRVGLSLRLIALLEHHCTMLTILRPACLVPTQGSPLTTVWPHCVTWRWRIPRCVATPLASAGSARSCLVNG
jgi:hypothetical protein